MKKIKAVMVSCIPLFLLVSCQIDDNGIDCSLIDPIVPSLHVQFMDNDGNNLIENGTFDSDMIRILNSDGMSGGQVVLPSESGNESQSNALNHTLMIFLPGTNTTETYSIQLNDTIMDTLILNIRRETTACGAITIPVSATYNGVDVGISESFSPSFQYRITIVR